MSTLSRVATPFGLALLRAISGSARAAFHDHAPWDIKNPEKVAASIAKRAAGTIAADWLRLSAIAAKAGMVVRSSGEVGIALDQADAAPLSASQRCQVIAPKRAPLVTARQRQGQLQRARLRGLERAHKAVGSLIYEIKHSDQPPEEIAIRVEALIEALRMIRRVIDGESRPTSSDAPEPPKPALEVLTSSV